MLLTDTELAWLDRRAEKIARERELSFANARPAAMAELIRMIRRPRAGIVDLAARKSRSSSR
jgi:hypothetical protein